MNRSQNVPDPETEDQASLWAARLEGSSLTAADRAELDSWLAGDPARLEMLSRFCRFSARLDRLVPELVASGSIKVVEGRARPGRGLNPWKLAAAGLVAAALAVVVVRLEWSGERSESISAPVGKRQSFTLSDGSRVELNANTAIFVDNGRAERRVRLSNGEAFFMVSKDKARPFIVETPAGSVRVTGTKFNVLTEAASQLEVTVVEGSVQVRAADSGGNPGSEPVRLEVGDRLTREVGGVSVRGLSPDELEDALAWRQGQIVCEKMPLSELLARVAHYHGCVITATPAAAGALVSGRYSINNLDEVLSEVAAGIKVRVERGADGRVRVSLPGEP